MRARVTATSTAMSAVRGTVSRSSGTSVPSARVTVSVATVPGARSRLGMSTTVLSVAFGGAKLSEVSASSTDSRRMA